MFKKILMSGLVLGALAATVGAGSYAAFTDSGSATGAVTAGTVNVTAPGTFTYTGSFCLDLAPGESCTGDVVVTNSPGSLAVVLSATPTVTNSNESCFSTVSVILVEGDGTTLGAIGIGRFETVRVVTELDLTAAEVCQGTSNVEKAESLNNE